VAVLVFAVVILLPTAWMFANSLIVDKSISFQNYTHVLSDARQLRLLYNTLLLGLGTTLVALVIGVPLAFLIDRTNIYLRRPLQYLYLVPLIIPPYMSTIAWIDLLGNRGTISLFLVNTLSLDHPLFTIYGLAGCIAILALSYFPFVTLLALSGLRSVDRRLEEAASLSHGELGALRSITVPLISPHILTGAIFVFIFALSNYEVPDLLRVNAYPVEIFVLFSAFYREGAATAASLPLILVTIPAILLIRHYMGSRSYVTLSSASSYPVVVNLGKWKKLAFGFVVLVFLLSAVLPITDLVIRSGSVVSYATALRTAHRQILTGIALAAIAATAMIVLGFSISYFIERSKGRTRGLMETLSLLPFAVPATVLGIGLISVWNTPMTQFVYGSSLIVLFGYTARFIPFVTRAIGSSLRQIHLDLEEAGLLCSNSWSQRMSKIVVPLAEPGILAGWCLAYAFSVGELGTTLLVIPPGEATLPIRIYTLMHYGASQIVAALCMVLVVVSLVPITFLFGLKYLTRPRSARD